MGGVRGSRRWPRGSHPGRDAQADVVVLDIGMPGLNGLDAARQIKRALPRTEVLIFTGEESDQVIHDVFGAGVRSYILKSDIGAHLVEAIRALGQHKHYFTSRISEVVFARYLDGASGAGKDKTEVSPRASGRWCSFSPKAKATRKPPGCWGSASRPWRPIAPPR